MSLNSVKWWLDIENKTIESENSSEFDENQSLIIGKELSELKSEEKKKQLEKTSDLEKALFLDKEEIIKDLCLSNYNINSNDFEVTVNSNIIIVYAKSSYFASLIWLNWIAEKEKCLNTTQNIRENYDELDKRVLEISKNPTEDTKKNLIQFCLQKWIDFQSVVVNGWCVINWESKKYVWIKATPSTIWKESGDLQWIIDHESQHIKFDEFCESHGIELNWYLKILDEVIAHCCNTKDINWNINFKKIKQSMMNNENYKKVSWLENYESILWTIIDEIENELEKEKLSIVMEKLILKYQKI